MSHLKILSLIISAKSLLPDMVNSQGPRTRVWGLSGDTGGLLPDLKQASAERMHT